MRPVVQSEHPLPRVLEAPEEAAGRGALKVLVRSE